MLNSICILSSDRSPNDANTDPQVSLSSCEYLQLNVSPFRQTHYTAASAAAGNVMVLPLIIS